MSNKFFSVFLLVGQLMGTPMFGMESGNDYTDVNTITVDNLEQENQYFVTGGDNLFEIVLYKDGAFWNLLSDQKIENKAVVLALWKHTLTDENHKQPVIINNNNNESNNDTHEIEPGLPPKEVEMHFRTNINTPYFFDKNKFYEYDISLHNDFQHHVPVQSNNNVDNYNNLTKNSDFLNSNQTKHRANLACGIEGCGKFFVTSKEMHNHWIEEHFPEKVKGKFKCPVCVKQFPWPANWNSHIATHTGCKEFECKFEFCEYACIQKDALKEHIKRNHVDEVLSAGSADALLMRWGYKLRKKKLCVKITLLNLYVKYQIVRIVMQHQKNCKIIGFKVTFQKK